MDLQAYCAGNYRCLCTGNVLNLLLDDGIWTLASVLIIVTVALNVIFLVERDHPLRWISPGLALTVIFVLYPILFTVYILFTNYGDGHLLTKQQVIEQYESQVYLPADATTYNYTAYTNDAGEYMLWLVSEDGSQVSLPPLAMIRFCSRR